MRALAVVISSFLLAAPVLAQPAGNATGGTASDTAATNSATSEEDPNRRICRRVDTNTGSRVPYRLVCMTAREWEAERNRR